MHLGDYYGVWRISTNCSAHMKLLRWHPEACRVLVEGVTPRDIHASECKDLGARARSGSLSREIPRNERIRLPSYIPSTLSKSQGRPAPATHLNPKRHDDPLPLSLDKNDRITRGTVYK